ncbi:MAG: PAS domain S-box protein [Natronomonas sp.]
MTDSIRVLHVDDDPEFADLTQTHLERENDRLVVEAVYDADEALDTLTEREFDCIISDHDMPGQTGIELLERVRQWYPDLPFILFTGKGSEEVASEAISSGVSDYLQKEFGSEQFELLANRIVNHVQRTRTLRDLAESESHLAQAQAVANIGSWHYDLTDNQLYWSDEVYEIFEVIPDEPVSFETFIEYVHPDDRTFVEEAWNAALEDGHYDVEHRIVTESGDTRWVRERAEIGFDDTGNPIDGIGVVQDITDRKERQRSLERAQRIVETAGDSVYALDVEGRFTMVNEQLELKTGYDRKELLGSHVSILLDDDDIERGIRLIRELLEGGDEGVAQYEAHVRTDNDGLIPIELRIAPLFDSGEFTGTVGVARDITKRKQHEHQLEGLNETTQELMTAATRDEIAEIGVEAARDIVNFEANAIHLVDADRANLVSVAATDAAVELVGDIPTFSDGDSIAWRVFEQGEAEVIDDIPADPDVFNPETPIRSELIVPIDEYGVFIAGSTEPDSFDERDVVLGEILTGNIAGALEQVERTDELRARQRKLAQQNETLEEFASIVSHDLRTPLNVARGRLELTRADDDRSHIDDVEDALDRMETLINDLLALARDDDPLQTESVELAAIAERCWRRLDTGDASLRLKADVVVSADVSQLQQLLDNLFRNSLEHSGGDVTVTVDELQDGFVVEDDGPGIPPEERTIVLQSGYSTDEDGTGLGLSIVNRIAEAHDWDIDVTTATSGGARFEFTGVERDE